MKEISPINFFKIYQRKKIKVIDVRDVKDYDLYHIKGSLNIPLSLLCDKPYLFLNKKYVYYIICKNGSLSKLATVSLENSGYNVINVMGGLDSWVGSYQVPY